jgi:hypothetical protein
LSTGAFSGRGGREVDQAGVAVHRPVLGGHVVAHPHLLKGGQLDLEELDRHPLDGDGDSVTTAAAIRLIASIGSSLG